MALWYRDKGTSGTQLAVMSGEVRIGPKAAIQLAIKKYDITEEHEQKRIAAWQERSP